MRGSGKSRAGGAIARVIVAVLIASLLSLTGPPVAASAEACDSAPTFVVTGEHLLDSDYNADSSQMAQDYRAFVNDDAASIEVLGVYVYETIYAVEPDGDWTRGSVNVLTEVWGVWPDSTEPELIPPKDHGGDPPNECGWTDRVGSPVGTRSYTIVTSDPTVSYRQDDLSDAELTAIFGAPDVAERDRSLEEELIAELDATRASSTRLFVGLGVAALALAGAIVFRARRA